MKRLSVKFLCLALSLLMVLCAAGCSEKKPLSSEEFRERCEDIGFTVTRGQTEEDIGITTLMAAKYSGFVLNYAELESSDRAGKVFDEIVEVYEKNNSSSTMKLTVNYGAHSYYHFTSGNSFYLVSRVENTLIYCTAEKAQKDSVIDVVKKLGYK